VVPALLLFQGSSSQTSTLFGVLPLVLMFAVMYFVLILPMQRQRKRTEKMLSELKNGDIVQTAGGIVGSIVSMDNDRVVLRVKPDNLKLQFARSAVQGVVVPEEGK
jgi:preprotein translocase subunit YajC